MNNNLVACIPPPGKPNLQLEATLTGPRQRVAQPAMKGNASGYYALNMIRERIGKNPQESQTVQRLAEKTVSDLRKRELKVYLHFVGLMNIDGVLRECLKTDQVTKPLAQEIVAYLQKGKSTTKELGAQIDSILKRFTPADNKELKEQTKKDLLIAPLVELTNVVAN